MKTNKIALVGGLAGLLALAGGLTIADAATAPKPLTVVGTGTDYQCFEWVYGVANSPVYDYKPSSCPASKHGEYLRSFNQVGPQGPSGVVATKTSDLGSVASVATGGPFKANATKVGVVVLRAGTYLLSVNAKATPPAGGTGAAQVFPQFFVYNGPIDPISPVWWSNDLYNVGSGALESGANATVDSYYSGATTITLAHDAVLNVYAFGYDSDKSAGSYILDDLTVTATAVNAG